MYLHKFLDETKPSNLAMKIFIISILLFSSCAGISGKKYKYIETSIQTSLLTTAPKEQKPILISANSDSDAYIKAYFNYCISKKYYNKEYQKSGAKAGEPLSFRLLNEESVDITHSVSFLNKEIIEKNIEKKVSLFELPKKDDK